MGKIGVFNAMRITKMRRRVEAVFIGKEKSMSAAGLHTIVLVNVVIGRIVLVLQRFGGVFDQVVLEVFEASSCPFSYFFEYVSHLIL